MNDALYNKVFKAYDIRGTVPDQLDETFAYTLGRAFVATLGVKEVVVGYDMRTSSELLVTALRKGIMDQGAHVIDAGMIPTDMLCFMCGKFEYESGIVVTASHNPPQWNGFKACLKGGVAISFDTGFEDIKNTMLGWGTSVPPAADQKGEMRTVDHQDDWAEHVLSFVDIQTIPSMKVVVDAGNGMGGEIARRVFARLPQIEMVPMYFEPDGTFPNHIANPIEEENLIDIKGKMEQEEAHVGIAFDADADRVGLVDETYETVTGTITTALLAEAFLRDKPGATILYNAICGRIVPQTIEACGGTAVRVRVGHSIIKDAMKEHHAVFGGEVSGHFFFQKNYNADSGIIAALLVLQEMGKRKQALSEMRKKYDVLVSSSELKFHPADVPTVLQAVRTTYAHLSQDELDGVSVYDKDWWANVRPSNTEPVVKLSIEAVSKEILEEKKKEFIALLS